jgi:hypothetical protein
MAQFYTKERTVGSAAPQIFDDSKRVLQEAENIIESMRAVSSIEERQNAALINNLRAHRQREKELNTRNHQMLMDNMKQVAEVAQRNAQVNQQDKALEAREKAAKEQQLMKTLGELSQIAGQAAADMVTEGIQQQTNQAREEAARLNELNPQATTDAALGLQAQLNIDAQAEVAQSASAYLAKDAGKDLNFVARMFVSPERVQRLRREVLVGEMATRIKRGYLEDYMRQNPEETVTIRSQGQEKQIPLSKVLAGDIDSSEDLNRIYSEVAHKLVAPLKGEADPVLFHKSDETIRNYINTRVHQFSEKLSRDSILEADQLKIDKILLADTPDELANNVVLFADQAGTNPFKDRGTAINQITNQILPNIDNPVAFLEALGTKVFRHMPDVPIKKTRFYKTLEREAYALQAKKDAQYIETSKAQGTRIGRTFLKGMLSDDQLVSVPEFQKAYAAVREKERNGTINFETARQAELELDNNLRDYGDSKLVNENIAYLSERQELNQEYLDSVFRSGHIKKELYDSESEKIAALSTVKLPNGLQYSKKSIRSQALAIASDKIGQFDVSGRPKHFSAIAAADLAAELYIQQFNELTGEFSPAVAAKKAWANVQAKMLNEEGDFFVDSSDEERGPIYSKLTTGDHTGALKVPKASVNSATQIGYTLRGDGVTLLDVKEYSDIDANLAVYASRINNNLPIKPTEFDQEVADAAGIPFHEMINRRFKALGIDAKATEGSFGIIRKASQVSPELQRVIDSPKTWNKLSSVTDRSPKLLPARMGNQSLGFINASSIARKFGHPNPELIAALWSLQTKDGSQQPDMTPAQQIIQIIDNNPKFNMFFDYAEIAQSNPELIPIMQKYGDSHNSFSGGSKTISRLSNSLGPSDMSRGAQSLRSSYGFSERGAAYLAGNIQQESGWYGQRKPWDDVGAPAGGIVSWRADRLTAIENYYGKPISQMSNKEQMDYMVHEMRTKYPEEYQVFMDPNSTDSQLKQASMGYWGYGDEGARYKYADQLLNKNE